MTPWESYPFRLASTRLRAVMAASSSDAPPALRSDLEKAVRSRGRMVGTVGSLRSGGKNNLPHLALTRDTCPGGGRKKREETQKCHGSYPILGPSLCHFVFLAAILFLSLLKIFATLANG